jgi:cobalamin biosynthesis protein CobD/CbiB
MVLRILARGGKGLGRLGAAIGGLAWNMVTYLVLPVLVVEEIHPVEAIIRSATLLKKTWGEQIVVNLSTDAIFGLPKLAVFGLLVLVVFQGLPFGSPVVFAVVIALLVVALLLLGLVESTLKGIYVAAVYRYAAQGEVGGFFSEEVVKGAFRPK